MSEDVISTLTKTINRKYLLDKDGRDWLYEEKQNGQTVKLRSPSRLSLGFSLDNRDKPPFAFLSGTPPEKIAKMCDAFIALCHQDRLYLFVIEVKNSPGGHSKQLANGKHFCNWLFSLFKEHGYVRDDPVYIGLVIRPPRKVPDKGQTSHRHPDLHRINVLAHQRKHFEHFFIRGNNDHIFLQRIIGDL